MNMNPRTRVWKEVGLTWGAQATCLMGCGGGAAQVDETRDSVCAFEWAAQVAGNARTHSLARAHTRMRMRMHMHSLTRAKTGPRTRSRLHARWTWCAHAGAWGDIHPTHARASASTRLQRARANPARTAHRPHTQHARRSCGRCTECHFMW
jgi:hypothetical protein